MKAHEVFSQGASLWGVDRRRVDCKTIPSLERTAVLKSTAATTLNASLFNYSSQFLESRQPGNIVANIIFTVGDRLLRLVSLHLPHWFWFQNCFYLYNWTYGTNRAEILWAGHSFLRMICRAGNISNAAIPSALHSSTVVLIVINGDRMSRQSWWQKIYWTRLAKPIEERSLFRYLVEHPVSSVLEVGVGEGARMKRIANLANLPHDTQQLRYIGVDEFESSKDRPFLTLKQAHRLATQLGLKASLIPGNPLQALPRVAHKFGPSDLIIIDGDIDMNHPTTGPIGSWLNRLAHSQSTVIACSQHGSALAVIDPVLLELPLSKAA